MCNMELNAGWIEAMLFGANSSREFGLKLTRTAYEKFRSDFVKEKDVKGGAKERNDRRCYGCGEEGHISAKCPRKSDGEKCFACNAKVPIVWST